MVDNITHVLQNFESLVEQGEIPSFWAAVQKDGLLIHAEHSDMEQKVPLGEEMNESLSTFFFGVPKIEYKSLDYANLKCFLNARLMLDRLLKKEGS